MNHGSFGFLHEIINDVELVFDQSILSALCLGDKSKLYGIYYPCPPPEKHNLYKDVTLPHDFMFTPIPLRFWPISARIYLHLSHRPGTINRICDFFADKEISILHGESTRSAFRYDTWSLHIGFQKLLGLNDLNYVEEKQIYKETLDAFIDLKESISKIPEINFFNSPPEYFKGFDGNVNSPLAFFNNYINSKKDRNWVPDPILEEPFEITLNTENNRKVFTGDKKFKRIVDCLKRNNGDLLPAITFSELDTRALNVRTVLIPPKDSKRFFMIGIDYDRLGGTDNCVGLIHSITKNLPKSYNIWQTNNNIKESSSESDKGSFAFFIEETEIVTKNITDVRAKHTYLEEAKSNIELIIADSNLKNVKFSNPTVLGLPDVSSMKLAFEINSQHNEIRDYKFDLFISYSHKEADADFVKKKLVPALKRNGIITHIDENELMLGDKVESTLLENILNSREMCVVISKNSVESEWVTTEWGAAWILNKVITPIIIPSEDLKIPDRLKNRKYFTIGSDEALKKFAKDVAMRKMRIEAIKFSRFFNK